MSDLNPGEARTEAQAADVESGLVAAREAYGPEWPPWLSMNAIDPEPEIEAWL